MTSAMKVGAKAVQNLRQVTGAGLMDCKRALVETEGDQERAIELLRKWGIATSAKREVRSATEGRIGSYVHHDGKQAALVELRCETDFVAKTAEFKALLADLCLHVVGTPLTPVGVHREDVPQELAGRVLLEQAFVKDPQKTVETVVREVGARLGEKIEVARFIHMRLGAG